MNGIHSERRPEALALSIPLALLIILASYTGASIPEFYIKETPNWQAQSVGQDIVNLFPMVPALLLSAVAAWRGNRSGALIWGGILLYLVYTFVIYCFDVHYNRLFLVYCAILGLSFYSLIYFLFWQLKSPAIEGFRHKAVTRVSGIYLMVTGLLFYFLWLSDIVPSLFNSHLPQDLLAAGLPTNPVHVIDLSIFLPGLFILGIQLLRNKPLAYNLTPALLVFCIAMDMTIGALVLVMKARNIEADLSVTFIMTGLAIISLALLVWYLSQARKKALQP